MSSTTMRYSDPPVVPHVRLRAAAQGIALGCVIALGVFAATLILVVKGGENVGPHLMLLSQYFIGYEVTFVGSLIGAAYGFVTGYLLGLINATIYNWFVGQHEGVSADGE